ncbi:MAG: hypothetical protein PF545_02940 [Elusimicrobia bacterium]|nr:hypothetical protein [Elusimicrobiota bacterium]
MVKSYSFDSAEINSIRKLVIANKKEIKRRWNEYFSK